MKGWKKGLWLCFLAVVLTLAGSGSVAVADDEEPGAPDKYHRYVYNQLINNGGKKWIKPIPSLSETEFPTFVEAYNHVIGLAMTGYADDITVWGQEDYWAKSKKTRLIGLGDCDDWSIYLAALLTYHTEQPVDVWVAGGMVTVPENGAGAGNAPRPYVGGHAWVVIPFSDDMWLVLDPVYPDVAAENPVVVRQYIPDLGGEFYVNEAYLEVFRFNNSDASGYLEGLLGGYFASSQ